jgi:hypothetical protein
MLIMTVDVDKTSRSWGADCDDSRELLFVAVMLWERDVV